MKNILITGIGGPTPRSIAKTIRYKYPEYNIIGVDANYRAIGFFVPGLVDKFFKIPRIDHNEYWLCIENIIKTENIDFAFVQPEKEVIGWGEYYKNYGFYPCPVFIPPLHMAVSLINKALMAELLSGTHFIPKTIKITQDDPKFEDVKSNIGFPCWIRASQGSGGLGSLKISDLNSYKFWLFIHSAIKEFTVSEFLPGRHLANQMLYYNGEYIKGASLECSEYVMADAAPSKVTGNTSFGRFINEDRLLEFCDDCIQYICNKLGVKAHGVLSFDLKLDIENRYKVTEINIRHMAYTGIMASVGFDLIGDTITILSEDSANKIKREPYFKYDKPYIFLRDVDIEPIILPGESVFP